MTINICKSRISFRISASELQLMSFLEELTGKMPVDCVMFSYKNHQLLIVTVKHDDLVDFVSERVIRNIRARLRCPVKVVTWSEDIEVFTRNALAVFARNARVISIDTLPKKGGETNMFITVPLAIDRGIIIGKKGRNIAPVTFLLKRYYGISCIKLSC